MGLVCHEMKGLVDGARCRYSYIFRGAGWPVWPSRDPPTTQDQKAKRANDTDTSGFVGVGSISSSRPPISYIVRL